MSNPSYADGKICYIEIPSTDIAKSSAFFQNVFGWNVRTRGDGAVAFDDSVGQVSGTWVLNRQPQTQNGFIVYIMVFDIPATVALITKHGGSVLSVDMESKEKTARFTDPSGNIFGLYQQQMS